jgi:hypothetical protein
MYMRVYMYIRESTAYVAIYEHAPMQHNAKSMRTRAWCVNLVYKYHILFGKYEKQKIKI